MLTSIVLAAGSSVRMGDVNKLLLPYKNKTVVETVVEKILGSGIQDVIVVLGFESELIKINLQHLPVQFVMNVDYTKGMTTSIQQGVKNANGNGYMICLADMIKVSSSEYQLLHTFFENTLAANEDCICMPSFNSQTGNPVIFSSKHKNDILNCIEMSGCKEIVQANKKNVFLLEMPTDSILTDMDYKEDYEKLF